MTLIFSIPISQFCYCVHLINAMAQLGTEIKKLFFITMISKLPKLMCFTDYVLKENMSVPINSPASVLVLEVKVKPFNYTQLNGMITYITLIIVRLIMHNFICFTSDPTDRNRNTGL